MSEGETTFRRVIVGVDGRTGGRDAIALGRMLSGSETRLMLAHVHPGEEGTTPADASSPPGGHAEKATRKNPNSKRKNPLTAAK